MNEQVIASKSKVYMVLEYVDGGELYEQIVSIFRCINFRLTFRLFPTFHVLFVYICDQIQQSCGFP